jgi:predicted AlkP superfamily pyrophosphatase or phosphodiesterase
MNKKIVIVLNIVGLSPALLEFEDRLPTVAMLRREGTYRKMNPGFPAVTCPVQATLLSGKPPADHGIVGNGYFDRITMRPEFWRQENGLVNGPRIWDIMRERDPNTKVAVMFYQNSKYIDADIVVTPSPLHTDSGMIDWCYSKPTSLYENLVEKIGQFSLKDYWGPLAGEGASRWIAQASLEVLKRELPDMLLAYIPHLDYVCQRHGPDSEEFRKELPFVDGVVSVFADFRKEYGPENVILFVISEYGLVPVKRHVCLNRILRENGLLTVREIGGGEYIDFEQSSAFAVVDHQIAHIYCKAGAVDKAKQMLLDVEGIASVLDRSQQCQLEIHHNRSGELIALAEKDCWFPYYYWFDDGKAPFFARTVDIHNKPGYDPCELFVDMETRSIPLRPELVKGSHGLPAESDEQLAIMICSDKDLDNYAPEPFAATQFLGMLYRVI